MPSTHGPLERVAEAREERKSSRRRLLGAAAASALIFGGLKLPKAQSASAQQFKAATRKAFLFSQQPGYRSIQISSMQKAVPYEGAYIWVTGLRGTVVGVRITLFGLYHENVGDLNILLTAPNGAALMLMAGVGEGYASPPTLNVSFDELLTNPPLPLVGPFGPGTYLATVDPAVSLEMPPPAPVAPNITTVAEFTGFGWPEMVGPWTLFIYDRANPAGGSLRDWGLELLTTNTAPSVRNHKYTMEPGTTLSVRRPGLLRGARDNDGDPLQVIPFKKNSRLGRIKVRRNGKFTFTAKPRRQGRVRFRYQATDGEVVVGGKITIQVKANEARRNRNRN